MKNWCLFIICLLALCFCSCVSNSISTDNNIQDNSFDSTELNNIDENTVSSISGDSEVSDAYITSENNQDTLQQDEVDSLPTIKSLLEKFQDIQLVFSKMPAVPVKNRTFASAFEVFVSHKDGNPIPNYPITLYYPNGKDGSNLTYETKNFVTDEKGFISFTPNKPTFAADDFICAYPTLSEDDRSKWQITESDLFFYEEFPMTITSFKVKSDISSKGAMLYVYEYNESEKPTNQFYQLISSLKANGVTSVGNAPLSDTSYIKATKEKVYKDTFAITGAEIGYLIGGTVKFVKPVEVIDNVYIATLCADFYCIEMKTGKVLCEFKEEYRATGKNWTEAVNNAKDVLATGAAQKIIYGL